MIKLTEHFSLEEFLCIKGGKPCPDCGGSVTINKDLHNLVYLLEILRKRLSYFYGKEVYIYIVSGHRCFRRNRDVSGCVPHYKSQHIFVAADIKAKVKGGRKYITPQMVYNYSNKIFILGGVGLYTGHVHVDVRGFKARW